MEMTCSYFADRTFPSRLVIGLFGFRVFGLFALLFVFLVLAALAVLSFLLLLFFLAVAYDFQVVYIQVPDF
jgi:hypothetical protein